MLKAGLKTLYFSLENQNDKNISFTHYTYELKKSNNG